VLKRSDFAAGLLAYALAAGVVVLAAWFGFAFVRPSPVARPGQDFWDALNRYDGGYYRDIAAKGYCWGCEGDGVMAFFPAYPLLIRTGTQLTGARAEVVAPVIAHVFLAGCFVLLHAYARLRTDDPRAAGFAIVALAVMPPGVFFRFGYSESPFLFVVLLFALAVEREWPILLLALIAGLATAVRAPGVALAPVVVLELWRRYPRFGAFLPRLLLCLPLALWGLLAFIAYQWHAFGEPLAFAKAQEKWRVMWGSWSAQFMSLATYEPAWGMYDVNSPRYWARNDFHKHEVFSLVFANPIYFTAVLLLIGLGAAAGWLRRWEVVLGLGLLAVPYLTRGFPYSMNSFGRFAAVSAPAYVVAGRLLARLPAPVAALLAATISFWLIVYAALFGAGWSIV
jgi:hypothetical protein